MKIDNFFFELKRRNVYKVAVAYAVVSWLLIQAASILFPTFDAPPWAMKVLVAVIALGFPIALVFSWAFEITPEGYVPAYSMAVVQLAFGDKDEAIRLLEKSYEDHAPFDSADLGWILVDHRLDPLRSDPRFKKLITRIFSGEPR